MFNIWILIDLVREIQKVDSRLVTIRGCKGGYIYINYNLNSVRVY